MEEADEQAYEQGSRTAWTAMLRECLRNLGDTERDAHSWRLEREAAVTSLRALCAAYGDNDWPDGLALEDVIDKHLARHLDAAYGDG